jgi:hypothetical protein
VSLGFLMIHAISCDPSFALIQNRTFPKNPCMLVNMPY